MNSIDISGINKADLLAALFNCSKVQGLGHLQPGCNNEMTVEKAQDIINSQTDDMYFDYVNGRVLKTDLSSDSLNP